MKARFRKFEYCKRTIPGALYDEMVTLSETLVSVLYSDIMKPLRPLFFITIGIVSLHGEVDAKQDRKFFSITK